MKYIAIIEEVNSAESIDKLRGEWEKLSGREESSFFLTWPWISGWLRIIPGGVKLYVVKVYKNHDLVSLSLFTDQVIYRNYILSSRSLALHECLMPGYNLMIEYNGILSRYSDQGIIREVVRALSEKMKWDEIYFSGVGGNYVALADAVSREYGCTMQLRSRSIARYVNLDKIRSSQKDYIYSLSKKTRYKLRQYLKSIESIGGATIDVPKTLDQSQEYFSELIDLHQAYWAGKGDSGVFSNSVLESFHRKLIDDLFDSSRVQILKVRCGDSTLGLVYSVIKNRKVYMIQSGYDYSKFGDNHPGYICLLKVIQYNVDNGNVRFDFMAGDSQYKRSLSNAEENMYWIVLQRRKFIYGVENTLRNLRRQFLALNDDVSI